MRTVNFVRLFILSVLIFVVVSAYAPYVFAQGECNGPGACPNDGGDTSISAAIQSVGGDNLRTYAVGIGGPGDVDINDCRESSQWGLVVFYKQKVKLNPWCAAETFDLKGMYYMAALMRCDIKDIRDHFASDLDCQTANTYTPPVPSSNTASGLDRSPDDYAQQEEEIEYLQEEQASLVGRIDWLTNYIEQAPVQQQEPEPFLNDSKRKALQELIEK